MTDEDLFEAFYSEHFDEVLRTAYLLSGSREEAMDLAQETFVRALQRWKRVREHENPPAWLQRVVANLSLSFRRRQRTRSRYPLAVVPWEPPPEAPEPAILAALRWLTPAQRAVVVLRYYADQSVDEVARSLGKRPGTVRALASQAIARVRPYLEAKGVRVER